MIAIDKDNTKRRTKLADETLYIVRSPNSSRTINYVMTTTAKKNDFAGIEPNWTTTIPLNNLYEGKVLTGINSTSGETRHTSESKGSVSAEAFEKTNSAKVEVVEYYKRKGDISSDQIVFKATELCEKFTDGANKVNSFLEKFGANTPKIEVKPKLSSSLVWYNEEAKDSRLYYDVATKDVTAEVTAKLKYESSLLRLASVISIPSSVDNQLSKILKAKFTFTPSLGVNLAYSYKERKWINKPNFEKWQQEGSIGVKFGLEAGLELELLPGYTYNPLEVKAEIKAKTGVDFKAALIYEPTDKIEPFKFKGNIILKPLVASGGVKIKTKKDANLSFWIPEFTLVDAKFETTIVPEIKLFD